jgi:hypothetical protein
MEIVACLEFEKDTDDRCSLPAEVTDRFELESTDGPIEHMSTRCLGGHVLMNFPVELLERASSAAPSYPAK